MNKQTRQLHDLGQSLWIDNITRTMLDDGTLAKYISDYSITGLTSNPSIFDAAIGEGNAYDAAIKQKKKAGLQDEKLFTDIALEDLRRAADLFKPTMIRDCLIEDCDDLGVTSVAPLTTTVLFFRASSGSRIVGSLPVSVGPSGIQ